MSELLPGLRFIDIGVNFTDQKFRGEYYGKKKHDDDFDLMLQRASQAGVKSVIITGGSLHESQEALQLAQQNREYLYLGFIVPIYLHSPCIDSHIDFYATVGCHPTRSTEFDKYRGGPQAYLNALDQLLEQNLKGKGRAVAVGECGLDYDRIHKANPEVQKKHFRSQLSLAKKYHLPLFLHSRAAHADFVAILREEGFSVDGGKAVGGKGGVVHSFTGTPAELAEVSQTGMGFHVSVNGCSLKTADNLAAAKAMNLDLLMLETDAPWCTMTGGHASKSLLDTLPASLKSLYQPPSVQAEKFVSGKVIKGRNEPCAIGNVAWVMHQLHPEVSFEHLTEKAWKNTVQIFGLDEST
ncbi:hypothetical protein GYMLUDRAFT_184736 [Collybiopsis luxurians FD-317 M1]|nr:hypothetical protein GYMLUDRAFT_184736 [Collybiopsis luxurians FD-317 M1]